MAEDEITIENGEVGAVGGGVKKRFAFLGKISRKWLIIGIAAFLLLSGGGVAGYYFFLAEQAPKEDLTLDEEELGIRISPEFPGIFPLEQLSVPLADSDVKLNLTISMELDFLPEEGWDELLDMSSQIQEEVTEVLGTRTMREIRNINGKILLKEELIFVINGVLETVRVRDIYFTEFVVR